MSTSQTAPNMNIPMSPLAEQKLAMRLAERRQKVIQSYINPFRRQVEEAEKLDHKATQVEKDIADYKKNFEGFRETVHHHRDIYNRRWALAILLCLISFAEYWIASSVASKMLPGVSDHLAALIYVGFFLALTVSAKFFTNRAEARADAKMATLEVGQESEALKLRIKKWSSFAAKAAVLALIAFFYSQVFNFRINLEEQRLELKETDKMTTAILTAPLFGNSGSTQQPESTSKADLHQEAVKLASGCIVLFVFLWIMHSTVLLMDARGLASECSLHGFQPGKAVVQAASLRGSERQALRKVAQSIADAPTSEIKDKLIDEVQPVARRLDETRRAEGGLRMASTPPIPAPETPTPMDEPPTPQEPSSPPAFDPGSDSTPPPPVDPMDFIFGSKTA